MLSLPFLQHIAFFSHRSRCRVFVANCHTGPSGTVKLAKKEAAAKPAAATKKEKPAAKVHLFDPDIREEPLLKLRRRLPNQKPQAPRQLVGLRRPMRRRLRKPPQRRHPPRQQKLRRRPKPKPTHRPNVSRRHLHRYVIGFQPPSVTPADCLNQTPAIVKEPTISMKTASGRVSKGPAKTAGAVQKKKATPKAKKAATPKKPKATPKKAAEAPAAAA